MLFFLSFPAQPDSQAGLFPVVVWLHMPVLAHMPKPQHGTKGSALGKGKKPATFQGFQGVPCMLAASKGPFLSTWESPPAPVPMGQPAQRGRDLAGWADPVTATFCRGSVAPIHSQH